MSKMKIYDIRFCKKEELPLLINFIKNHWQSDHILVKSKKLIDFQHLNKLENVYNFIIGFNRISQEIDGIIGLIPISHYDKNLTKYNDAWGGIWKVRFDVKNEEISSLGSHLFSCFEHYNSHGSIGMSKIALFLHKIKKYKIGVLDQYYILNKEITDFKIAQIPKLVPYTKISKKENNIGFIRIKNILDYEDFDFGETYYPKKSINYLYNRFSKHPIYRYEFWEIFNDISKIIIVTRKIYLNESSIIRIVDMYGKIDQFEGLYDLFQEILKEEGSEYIDILNFGISKNVFSKIGFKKLNVKDVLIIPNYFEPFIRENKEINCAYRSQYKYVFFKADADQDRPSII